MNQVNDTLITTIQLVRTDLVDILLRDNSVRHAQNVDLQTSIVCGNFLNHTLAEPFLQ